MTYFDSDHFQTSNLWSANTPARFWNCRPEPEKACWQEAIQRALPALGLSLETDCLDEILALVLGEGLFSPNHWQLSRARRWYYAIKPVLPRSITQFLRKMQSTPAQESFPLGWPIESRYADFQWEVMKQILLVSGQQSILHVPFWPNGARCAFVITHDVETGKGQSFVHSIADLDERFGFRACFNIVPQRYTLDQNLLQELRERGFEIGVHGLKHDGKLFHTYDEFIERVKRINAHLKALGAVGFRSPYMLRNPEWMQALEVTYDMSFFDTDPFEPLPGGTMSIWPFHLGHFVELPYTLVQDHTLTAVLGETTPQIWLVKTAFLEKYHGLILINTHPDYLIHPLNRKIYATFLETMRNRAGYWHALPSDAARWWSFRSGEDALGSGYDGSLEVIGINEGNLTFRIDPDDN